MGNDLSTIGFIYAVVFVLGVPFLLGLAALDRRIERRRRRIRFGGR